MKLGYHLIWFDSLNDCIERVMSIIVDKCMNILYNNVSIVLCILSPMYVFCDKNTILCMSCSFYYSTNLENVLECLADLKLYIVM